MSNPQQHTASYTSTYWIPGNNYETIKASYPISGHLGFMFDLPREQPVAGPWYFGEGREYIAGDRRMVYRSDPEYFAVDNVIPAVNGKAMVDVSDPAYSFNREDWTR